MLPMNFPKYMEWVCVFFSLYQGLEGWRIISSEIFWLDYCMLLSEGM